MLKYLKQEANLSYTENGAVTHASSGSCCLDLFSTIGALRQAEDSEVCRRFSRAYAENPDLAMKIAFYARDVRGGLGERRVFRVILRYLAFHEPESLQKNLEWIAQYGRYDDLLALFHTPSEKAVIHLIEKQLQEDVKNLDAPNGRVSLLGKWLPSVNATSPNTVKTAKRLARALGLSDAQYRRTLSRLRAKIAILENNLREGDYTFEYAAQPSRAMFKYRQAFVRNDGARYSAYIQRVKAGKEKLHTGALFPYEIVAPYLCGPRPSRQICESLDATWNALPDYANGEDALVVVDGSGSMYQSSRPSPAAVALSLGVYFAERNKGAFHGHFITFSETPKLVHIKGADLVERIRFCASYNEVANTNLEAVFQLILRTAVKRRLKQKDLPKTLYMISDMEFDCCTSNAGLTNFQSAKKQFKQHGYTLPQVVFWNVSSRNLQQPVTQNEQGVALVSGCSPRLFQMVLSGNFSPYQVMIQTLSADRYNKIAA